MWRYWPKKIRVSFKIDADLSKYGPDCRVAVVGDIKELGMWDSKRSLLTVRKAKGSIGYEAPFSHDSSSYIWYAEVCLQPKTEFEWKLAIVNKRYKAVAWETRDARNSSLSRTNVTIETGWNDDDIPIRSRVITVFETEYHIPKDSDVGGLAVCGSIHALGTWHENRAVIAREIVGRPGVWRATAFVPYGTSYSWKWVVLDTSLTTVVRWEECANRKIENAGADCILSVNWSREGVQVRDFEEIENEHRLLKEQRIQAAERMSGLTCVEFSRSNPQLWTERVYLATHSKSREDFVPIESGSFLDSRRQAEVDPLLERILGPDAQIDFVPITFDSLVQVDDSSRCVDTCHLTAVSSTTEDSVHVMQPPFSGQITRSDTQGPNVITYVKKGTQICTPSNIKNHVTKDAHKLPGHDHLPLDMVNTNDVIPSVDTHATPFTRLSKTHISSDDITGLIQECELNDGVESEWSDLACEKQSFTPISELNIDKCHAGEATLLARNPIPETHRNIELAKLSKCPYTLTSTTITKEDVTEDKNGRDSDKKVTSLNEEVTLASPPLEVRGSSEAMDAGNQSPTLLTLAVTWQDQDGRDIDADVILANMDRRQKRVNTRTSHRPKRNRGAGFRFAETMFGWFWRYFVHFVNSPFIPGLDG